MAESVAHGDTVGARNHAPREPIAIVGIGCRFPGQADTPDAFWRLLREGVDAVVEVPPDRWDVRKFYDADGSKPGKTVSRWGGFLESIDRFDAQFFGISPREAASMDPQQRLVLEVAWEAIEDAGVVTDRVAGEDVGVFVGISTFDYGLIQMNFRDTAAADSYTNTGIALSIAANRVSYCFNFNGPCAAVDTACSSSLVAVHMACQSLWNEECRMAMAGGVNALIAPGPFLGFTRLSMLSPDGRCKAFDAGANGFVRAEGAGVVVLKRLAKARADGDRIYALIRGTALNQDGRSTGLTVPSQRAQEALVREACLRAGVDPARIRYVEAHGTGTLVGDPIEARALGGVLGVGRPAGDYCRMGSAKTNIGHLEAAAGMAGLIKAALVLNHGEIPPNLHFRVPNPDIDFDGLRLRVPTALEAMPAGEGPALAGVNSFGFGGSNAHVVLEAPPAPDVQEPGPSPEPQRAWLIPLSARSPEALQALALSYGGFLEAGSGGPSLADVAYTTSMRRAHHEHRLAVVARSCDDLAAQLRAFAAGDAPAGCVADRAAAGQRFNLAFVFSGQGPQWWAMGRQLLAEEPVFREVVERIDHLVRSWGAWSLLDELLADESRSRMQETAISQPAIFAVQAGLLALLKAWGIQPDAVIGHSVGEVAAAHAAGVLSLEDAARVIFHRGRCMDLAPARGRMLAAALTAEEARLAIEPWTGRVEIGAVNSPTSVTLTGDAQALAEVEQALGARKTWCRFLQVEYAFHSFQMDPVEAELRDALRGIQPRQAVIPMCSTVTGGLVEGPELTADYWWRNVRQTVLFAAAVDRLAECECHATLELSPHPVLTGSVAECFSQRGKKVKTLTSLRRDQPERAQLLKSLGALHAMGRTVHWPAVAPAPGRLIRLPSYPWQRERYWQESDEAMNSRLAREVHPLLGTPVEAVFPTWESRLAFDGPEYLRDHAVQGRVLVPGTAFVEIALALARETVGEGPHVLEEIAFQKACFLHEGEAQHLRTVFNPNDSTFTISSRPEGTDSVWTTHVTGTVKRWQLGPAAGLPSLDELRQRCPLEGSQADCYAIFEHAGFQFGPAFRGLERIWLGENEAVGLIRTIPELEDEARAYRFHPAVLDACFQVDLGVLFGWKSGLRDNQVVYLPVEHRELRVYGRPTSRVWCHARLLEKNRQSSLCDVLVFDENGTLILEGRGFVKKAIGTTGSAVESLSDLLYEYQWQFQPGLGGERAAQGAGPCLRLADAARHVEAGTEALVARQDSLGRWEDAEAEFNRACTTFIWNALEELGADLQPGHRFTDDGLAARLRVDGAQRRAFERYLDILEEDGILRRTDEAREVSRRPVMADSATVCRELLTRHPAYFAELRLILSCGRQLARALRGEVTALEVIFPHGSMGQAEQLYTDSASLRLYNVLAQRAVARMVDDLPADRTIRVLEIGAGTGGLTTHVLPVVPADRTEYVFTDLSNLFFAKAQEKFREYSFVRYQRLDIEQDPLDQGYPEHAFDLVLAPLVLHATADLRQTLGHVRRLLRPGGAVLLVELVKPVRYWDLVFGLTDGWWRFADRDLRPSHPTLPFRGWKALLEASGFEESVGPWADKDAAGFNFSVILARGPREDEAIAAPEPARSRPDEPGTWLLFADAAGLGEDLAARLESLGEYPTLVYAGDGFSRRDASHYTVRPESRDDLASLLSAALGGGRPPCRGLVYLWALDVPAPAGESLGFLEDAEKLGCLGLVHLLQAWTAGAGAEAARLWLVTRGVHPVGPKSQPVAVAQSLLWGLGRVVMNEFPGIRCTTIDLGGEAAAAEGARLFEEFWAADREDEVALRGDARYVHRYQHTSLDEHAGCGARPAGEPFRLEVSRSGLLDGLTFRASPREAPRPGMVEIQVAAAALNFSDVLKALGLYPGLPDGAVPIGIECAGVVSALGDGVEGLAVGDAVVALAFHSLGAYALTQAEFVVRKPARFSFEEAVTIPIAFLTAHWALNQVGRMAAGERVLIHSATGGVGLAAIQLARNAGAEVFATAGTQEKRELLELLGIEHVMDSRTLAFADEIVRRTGGKGMDLVLNSLAGEALTRSLSLVGEYGRFLEIGKRDIYQNSRVGLRPFRNNVSFNAIDLDRLIRQRPATVASMLRQLMQQAAEGAIHPLPHRVFPMADAVEAFRYFAKAQHTGKVVISMQEAEVPVSRESTEAVRFRPDATYLITGGLGGFGLSVAQWMVEQGARHLVLVGRRGIHSPEASSAVEEMGRRGARVVVSRADISHPDQVAEVLALVARELPPLRGVVHAAMVPDDCVLLNLDREVLRRVLAPKVDGAWNLHVQTRGLDLDFFVLFSSMTSVFGNPGQGNYAAANSFLDALAHYRRALGLPGLAINWGWLSEVGIAARNAKLGERFESFGVKSFSPREAATLLGQLLTRDTVQIGFMRVDWERMNRFAEGGALSRRFAHMCLAPEDANDGHKGDGQALRNAVLAAATAEDREELMLSFVRDEIAGILGAPASRLEIDKPLNELGFDSLMGVELHNWIEGELRVSLPIVELMQGPSVKSLAHLLVDQIAKTVRQAPEPARKAEARETAPAGPPEPGAAQDADVAQGLKIVERIGARLRPVDAAAVDLRAEAVLDESIRPERPLAVAGTPARILLTGATGFLGSWLLHDLLDATDGQVSCLVRGVSGESEAAQRVERGLRAFGLWDERHRARIIGVPGDLAQPLLGLGREGFDRLARSIDAVYHCGARVEFVYPYESLRPENVLGTREVLSLACRGNGKPFHYVSTLAVFSLLDHAKLKTVREIDVPGEVDALPGGYLQSKWVAERMVRAAADRGLPVAIYRPGVVTGDSRTGAGTFDDVLTRLILSCVQTGLAPASALQVRLTPVEYVSRAIVHLALRHPPAGEVYHLVAERLVGWDTLLDWIGGAGYSLRRVRFDEWRGVVAGAAGKGIEQALASLSPLIPELAADEDLFGGPVFQFDCANTHTGLAGSGIACPPADAAIVGRYLAQAVRAGLIDPPSGTDAGMVRRAPHEPAPRR